MAFKIFAFVFPLGLDTLALAIALGLRGFPPWPAVLLFSIFETAMPVFGISLALFVSPRVETAAVVIGGIVLIAVGAHAVREALRGEKEVEQISFGSARSLLLAGLAISTDELAAGFPLGVSGLPVPGVLITIGVQTVLLTLLGVAIGNRARRGLAARASRYAGVAAGIAFTAVGLWLIAGRLAPRLWGPSG
ncbi:MAG TPA: manganese efflux pump [Candidatus Cybelea sp.]|nr:manganese efflux pump [Candidatus Cybelea sp.]